MSVPCRAQGLSPAIATGRCSPPDGWHEGFLQDFAAASPCPSQGCGCGRSDEDAGRRRANFSRRPGVAPPGPPAFQRAGSGCGEAKCVDAGGARGSRRDRPYGHPATSIGWNFRTGFDRLWTNRETLNVSFTPNAPSPAPRWAATEPGRCSARDRSGGIAACAPSPRAWIHDLCLAWQ